MSSLPREFYGDDAMWMLRSYEPNPGDKLVSEIEIGPDTARTLRLIEFLFDCEPDPYGSTPIAPPFLASPRVWFIDCDGLCPTCGRPGCM